MAEIDLHKLANEPGFGKAQKVLEAAGLVDWSKSGRRCEWAVEVEVTEVETVYVTASSKDEAMRLAEDEVGGVHAEATDAKAHGPAREDAA